jgi:ABC-type uncharacterized transport system involved in gliding motility auxiliary subunit
MAGLHSFRAARWLRTINLVLQAALFLSLIGGLNYLALHRSWRFDLTAHRRYSLSPETLSYLAALEQPVEIIVTLERDAENSDVAEAFRDMHGLLREYVNATLGKSAGRVTVRYLDVYQQRREAEALGIDQTNIVIARSGDRRRIISPNELYIVRGREKQAFTGEQAVTAAILDVSKTTRERIYFLTGHGEMSPDDVDARRGLSVFADELRQRNFDVATLNLLHQRGVPDDAALLIIVAPSQGRYQPQEVEWLRRYLSDSAGRLLLLLPPGRSPGLDDLLYDWGVLADDVVVYDTDPASATETGLLRVPPYAPHRITDVLFDYQIPLTLGATRVVRPDPGRPLDENLTVTVLAATSPSAWGERDYEYRLQQTPRYDAGVDLKGQPHLEPRDRLSIAVASERVTPPENLPYTVPSGRLVVFGNADFASNNRLAVPGNQAVLLSAVDWCVGRRAQLKTPPRPIERYQLNLSQQELTRLRYSLLFVLPGATAILGLLVYWARRT